MYGRKYYKYGRKYYKNIESIVLKSMAESITNMEEILKESIINMVESILRIYKVI